MKSALWKQIVMTLFCDLRAHVTFGRCAWMALFLVSVAGALAQVTKEPAPVHLPLIDGKDIRFTRLSTTDGLSQTRVAQIVQDDLGFIWFGTQYGLNRFDGYEFKVFVHNPRSPESLSGAFISSLFKDRQGYLWVGCAQTLDRFDPVTETFKHYRVDTDDPEGLSGTVVHISEDRSGMLWLATGTGLYRLDPASGRVLHYRHRAGDPTSLSSDDVKSSGEDNSGTFWVGTSEGLDAFDRETGKVTLHVQLPEPVQISFYEDRLGVFWIAYASGNGLAVFDRKTRKLTRYSFYEKDPPAGALTGVMGMLEDREGNLWLGSPGAGLLRFDREHQRFIRYRNNPTDPSSLAEDKVIALFEDREGNVWTGLHSMGPNHFSQTPPHFETFQLDPAQPDGLDMNFVNAMYEDHDGILWIGNDSGLHRLDRKTGRYTHWNAGLGVKPMIITITEDHSGNLWVGTYGHGLARFDRRNGQFTVYQHRPDDPSSLSNDQVHRLFVDHAGNLWAGTDDGLNRFDPATGRFTVYRVDPQSRWSQSYVAIAEDRVGILWLGTHYSGLHRFDPATGQFTVYKSQANVPGTLRDNMVPTVLIDRVDRIWVGTESGLDKLDPQSGKFIAYNDTEGVRGRTVTCLLEDNQGGLWLSSNTGISHFDPRDGTFRSYTGFDGLPGNDFTGWGTGHKSPSGELFFGGFAGGIAFHPERLVESTYVPPVVLTDFHSAGAPVDGARSIPQKSINYAKSVALKQPQNNFSIQFSALSYVNPAANRYRYRLEGLDRNWNENSSDRRQVSYTTLPVGSYQFQVQGATGRGPWSDPGATLDIEILPVWWQTWWLRGIVVLAVIAASVGAYRVRVATIKEREREFRMLAENAPDMVVRFDRALRYRYANPMSEQYLGIKQEELLGKTNEELGILASNPAFDMDLSTVFGTGRPLAREFVLETANRSRLMEARFVPERGAHGIVRSVLAIMRDITERRRAEEDLRKVQAELAHVARVTTMGELAASIAHEVNQPITGVLTNGNACLRWLAKVEENSINLTEVRASVGRILRDGKRAGDVIGRIRALFKKAEAAKERLDLNEAIREVIALSRSEMSSHRIVLQLELAPDLVPVIGDRVQLQQVVLNLILNAIEAMIMVEDRPRELVIRTRVHEQTSVLVTVRDTGPGLDPGSLDKVFAAFHTTKPGGLGMGLSISRSIVESHYGRLWVTANEGPGAAFHFTLLAHRATDESESGS
jgi:PAS domain S-box-containing protein